MEDLISLAFLLLRSAGLVVREESPWEAISASDGFLDLDAEVRVFLLSAFPFFSYMRGS